MLNTAGKSRDAFVRVLFLSSILMPVATIAQTAAAPAVAPEAASPSGEIADIVVTAQRRSESLSKVPIAVTAITPAQLETSGIGSTIDLPRITPGLTVGSSTQANAYFTPVLRGVGALTPAVANDNSVALYVDGVYQSDKTASNIDLAAISQIEVLKGPQGTLFGRNATGGAITVTTRGPTDHTEIEGEASYGNLDKFSGRLFGGTPITDTLGVSVAYLHRLGGDYEQYTNPLYSNLGKFGGTGVDAINGKIIWRPGNFEAIASFIYYDRQYTDLNPVSPVPGTIPIGVQVGGTAGFARYTYTGTPDYGTVKYFQPSLHLRYSLPGFDIVSITGYDNARTTQGLDYDGTSANLFYFGNLVKVEDVSQELQVLTTGNGPLQATGGLYYYRGVPKSTLNIIQNAPREVANDPTLAPVGTVPGGSVTHIDEGGTINAKAVYGQATYSITSNTKFTAGLRYSDESRNYHYAVSGAGGPGTGLPPSIFPFYSVTQPTVDYKKLTWRFALDHEFSDDILGYVSYNRGFKSGVYNFSDFSPPCAPGATTGCPPAAVKPEVLDAFEAGIKSKFFDRTLQINAAAFYYNYRNLQVSSITATAAQTQLLENAGSEHIYGFDGDIIWRATPDLTFRANGSYLHARFGSFPNAGGFRLDANGVPFAASIDASGTQGLGAPTVSFDVGADYTLSMKNDWKIVFTGDYFHTSSFKTVVGDGNVVFAYDRANAAATLFAPRERYYVRVFGQNLTDLQQIGVGTSPFRLGKAEIEPRTYGVAIGFKL